MTSRNRVASNRSFGILLGVVFVLIAIWNFSVGGAIYPVWASVGLVFFLVAWLVPRLLRPLKGLWLRFGHLMGRILSPVALTLIYVLSIVPVGLLLKAFRKDSLRLIPDRKSASYWIAREPPGPSPESLKNQF